MEFVDYMDRIPRKIYPIGNAENIYKALKAMIDVCGDKIIVFAPKSPYKDNDNGKET